MLGILYDSKVVHLEDIHDSDDTVDGTLINATRRFYHRVIFDNRNIRRTPVYDQSLHADFDEILASQLLHKRRRTVSRPC